MACQFCVFITEYSARLYFKFVCEHEQIQTKQDTVRDEVLCLLNYQHRGHRGNFSRQENEL